MTTKTLTNIISKEDNYTEKKIIKIPDIDKYIVELIRISKIYKFELKIRRIASIKKPKAEKDSPFNIKSIEEQIGKVKEEIEESLNEIVPYKIVKDNFSNDDIKISYNIKPKTKDIEYKVKKPKTQYQELWEKEGFYQERTTQARVKVQLFPEHLPYDHFKRKRAFLFC